MKLSSIPQISRHVGRWYEILTVLEQVRAGGVDRAAGAGFRQGPAEGPGRGGHRPAPWETRLRMALAELGPTFIKLGQILSTRPDLVGVRLAEEFQQLQENVPADPPEVVRKLIEAELGRPIEELFAEFEPQAMASASIGQVHRARLHSGEAVVVKVLHADIEKKVAVDMDILGGLAMMADMLPEFRNYRPSAIVAEFQRAMRRELDFGREERNIQQFARDFRDDPTVHIPRTYPDLSSRRVLTMELLDGIKLSERQRLAAAGHRHRRSRPARRGHLSEDDLRQRLLSCRSASRQSDGDGGLPDRAVGFRHGRPDRRAAARGCQRNTGCLERSRRRTHDGHDPAAGQDAGRPGPLRA